MVAVSLEQERCQLALVGRDLWSEQTGCRIADARNARAKTRDISDKDLRGAGSFR